MSNKVSRPCKLVSEPNNAIPHELKYFDELPNSAHVPIDTVGGLYNCSISTVWRRVRTGEIIEPIRFGSRTTRWNVGDLRIALLKNKSKGAHDVISA